MEGGNIRDGQTAVVYINSDERERRAVDSTGRVSQTVNIVSLSLSLGGRHFHQVGHGIRSVASHVFSYLPGEILQPDFLLTLLPVPLTCNQSRPCYSRHKMSSLNDLGSSEMNKRVGLTDDGQLERLAGRQTVLSASFATVQSGVAALVHRIDAQRAVELQPLTTVEWQTTSI